MATKKSDAESADAPHGRLSVIEERRKAKENATTVDGSESPTVSPPGDPAEAAKERGVNTE